MKHSLNIKYKPLQKQLLVCNRSCKQNLAFKNTIKGEDTQ